MKHLSHLLTLVLLGLLSFDCENSQSTQSTIPETEINSIAAQQLDNRSIEFETLVAYEMYLQSFAKSLARTIDNQDVSHLLKQEIGKKFDGDNEVLWKSIKNHKFGDGILLKDLINKDLHRFNAMHSMNDIEQIPCLQIAFPYHFDDWDGTSPVLVAYTPLTTNDIDWKFVQAYDNKGNEYYLDAHKIPDAPVMVVSINERTDEEGNLKYGLVTNDLALSKAMYTGNEKLVSFEFSNDRDPFKGKPEVYFVIAGTNSTYDRSNKIDYPNANYINTLYTVNDVLFGRNEGTWGAFLGWALLEQDWTTQDYTINIISASVVEIRPETHWWGDDDDIMGTYDSMSMDHSTPFSPAAGVAECTFTY